MCLAGCERHVQKREKVGMGRPHGRTIWEDAEYSMCGGYRIGTGIFGAKEMATVARVGNGAMGRVVGNKRSN